MSQPDGHDRTLTLQIRLPGGDAAQPASPPLQGLLTVIRGQGADLGQSLVLEAEVLIGRAPECHLRLTDPGVSWRHARVQADPEGDYWLQDLGSTNGTRVRERSAEAPLRLQDGEKILLGGSVLRFALADEVELGYQREVAQLVSTDPLTGLESKRVFDDALDTALTRARLHHAPVALLMLDMDGVKAINDAHGHLFGAHCIGETGRLIGRVVGPRGRACRFGGDEFAVFLPGHDLRAACELAERIRAAVDQAGLQKAGLALHPTVSIGVAAFPDQGEDALDLTSAADAALYRAKARGKNQVSV